MDENNKTKELNKNSVEEYIERLERYADAYEEMIELGKITGITDDVIERAERVLDLLAVLEDKYFFIDDDTIERAEKYLKTITAILESEKKLKKLKGD